MGNRVPVLIADKGKPLIDRLKNARLDQDDVFEAARENHGLERMAQVKYAVLETTGKISIIPESSKTPRD